MFQIGGAGSVRGHSNIAISGAKGANFLSFALVILRLSLSFWINAGCCWKNFPVVKKKR
jgi:hemolysin activation/secretion protein